MKYHTSKKLKLLPAVAVIAGLFLVSCSASDRSGESGMKKLPVIFDTDIGDDIDDTWALISLLNSPELDVKLITTSVGDTKLKAKMIAKILETAGRTDIPIGVGVNTGSSGMAQRGWIEGYDLSKYPGTVKDDGVSAIVKTVMQSKQKVTIISVGPLPNVAAALKRQPAIATKAKFIGMHGSIRKGYNDSDKIDAEYNVKAFPKDAQKVFSAKWGKTITPLDTCGIVVLKGGCVSCGFAGTGKDGRAAADC